MRYVRLCVARSRSRDIGLTRGLACVCEGVPIFNIDKRPFATLCAYSTGERTTPFVSICGGLSRVVFLLNAMVSYHQLEGHELSYLRAIGRRFSRLTGHDASPGHDSSDASIVSPGVIILSAVLKRRMILADKAKSLFISK